MKHIQAASQSDIGS